MSDGFLLVDKPAGPSSHDVVTAARRATGVRRVGHAGTLDPFATGLLTLLVGRCTRLAPFLVGLDKRYDGTLVLGASTETDDATGMVIAAVPVVVDDAALRTAMAGLTGTSQQVPPAYSARQVAGRRAYRAARRGERLDLDARTITVHAFDLVARDGDRVTFRAHVSSGTYVRALARDLGTRLGCGAHLAQLRRTAVGPWSVEDAVPLDAVRSGEVALGAPRAAVPHLPTRALSADEALAVRHGRPVPNGDGDGPIALLAGDALLAVAVHEGGALQPKVVLAA